MHIAHVIAECDHASSGTSYFIVNACEALARSGVDVSLHALRAPQLKNVAVKNYHRYSGWRARLGWSPEMLAGLRREAKDADVIHTNGLWMMPNVYPAWVHPRKFVVSPHGTLSAWALGRSRLKKKLFGCLAQNPALRRADMFFATSEKEYEEIRVAGYRQPVAIIPIGIDVPSEMSKRRKSAGVLKRIVFLGRLHPIKAIDRLLEAWNSCRADGWEVVIAGPDGGARAALEGLVETKEIPRVRFVGELLGPDKEKFLHEADILALVSHTENFGASVVEALSVGTPVLAARGTPWKGVEEKRCGWWVDNSVEQLTETLGRIVALPYEELVVMGERGQEWMRRDFSWDGIGMKMKAAYVWLVKGGNRPEYVKVD